MKRILLLALAFNICIAGTAQDIYKQGFLILKGKIKNAKADLVDYWVSGYFRTDVGSFPIKPDGCFEARIPIQHRQGIRINSTDEKNDNSTHFIAKVGDTVEITWDEKAYRPSLTIMGTTPQRTKQLKLEMVADYVFDGRGQALRDSLSKMIPEPSQVVNRISYSGQNQRQRAALETDAFETVSRAYNQQIADLLRIVDSLSINKAGYEDLRYFIAGVYYEHCEVLLRWGLIPRYTLWLTQENNDALHYKRNVFDFLDKKAPNHNILNEVWFRNVPGYRRFLENYVWFGSSLHPSGISVDKSSPWPFDPTLGDYHTAQAELPITGIREWFVNWIIMFGFTHYDFTKVENVYRQAVETITNPYLKTQLEDFHATVSKLRAGSPAPGFTLENEKGKQVSLSDFKGKVVYLNFWGVYCGPCIADFKKQLPENPGTL